MAAYLTRIEINPRRRASGRVLSSPHRMHGAVNACFPPSASPARVLWRVDRTAAGTLLYVLSDVAPDPTGFVEEHGWPLAGGWRTRDYDPVLEEVVDGRTLAFRLTANPVQHLRPPSPDGNRVRGKRVAHVTAAHQLRWFVERASEWGFTVGTPSEPTCRIVERRTLQFRRQERQVTVGYATFEGLLVVTDVAKLRRRLLEGIGPAKAYGCGLLTLARAEP